MLLLKRLLLFMSKYCMVLPVALLDHHLDPPWCYSPFHSLSLPQSTLSQDDINLFIIMMKPPNVFLNRRVKRILSEGYDPELPVLQRPAPHVLAELLVVIEALRPDGNSCGGQQLLTRAETRHGQNRDKNTNTSLWPLPKVFGWVK